MHKIALEVLELNSALGLRKRYDKWAHTRYSMPFSSHMTLELKSEYKSFMLCTFNEETHMHEFTFRDHDDEILFRMKEL